MPGASTGIPTHDKVMWESSGGQGEPELEGCPTGPAWASTPNQSLPTLLLCDLTYTSDFTGGCPPPLLSEKELTYISS